MYHDHFWQVTQCVSKGVTWSGGGPARHRLEGRGGVAVRHEDKPWEVECAGVLGWGLKRVEEV